MVNVGLRPCRPLAAIPVAELAFPIRVLVPPHPKCMAVHDTVFQYRRIRSDRGVAPMHCRDGVTLLMRSATRTARTPNFAVSTDSALDQEDEDHDGYGETRRR